MHLKSYAKTNLYLRILGKRDDGFHDIETLMVKISLADELEITQSNGPAELTCSQCEIDNASNLVMRAVRLLERHCGSPLPVAITLMKHIPAAAGLGGGSSDAASTLIAVNELENLHLSSDELQRLAAELGSDIPFFLHNRPCICHGRGECTKPIEFPWSIPLLLLRLPLDIPTPWAYGRWAISREVPGFSYAPQMLPWGEMTNDLERPVFEKYLILGEMKSWLLSQPEVDAALLSGSGSAMIAVLKDAAMGALLQQRALDRYGPSLWTAEAKSFPSP